MKLCTPLVFSKAPCCCHSHRTPAFVGVLSLSNLRGRHPIVQTTPNVVSLTFGAFAVIHAREDHRILVFWPPSVAC